MKWILLAVLVIAFVALSLALWRLVKSEVRLSPEHDSMIRAAIEWERTG